MGNSEAAGIQSPTKAAQVNLRKQARDRECQIRIPNQCLQSTETVVLCHVRMIGLSGIGMKSPDIFGAHGCQICHAIVDGQRKSDYTFEERRLFLLEGMVRTQAILLSEGKIRA